jgi:hypothetical protein
MLIAQIPLMHHLKHETVTWYKYIILCRTGEKGQGVKINQW